MLQLLFIRERPIEDTRAEKKRHAGTIRERPTRHRSSGINAARGLQEESRGIHCTPTPRARMQEGRCCCVDGSGCRTEDAVARRRAEKLGTNTGKVHFLRYTRHKKQQEKRKNVS